MVILGAFILVTALMAAMAGLAAPLPIGREVVEVDGFAQPVFVLNPESGLIPSCQHADGDLKIVVPIFALVRTEPHFGGTTIATIERGDLVTTFEQTGEGWWKISIPGECSATGWVRPETFQTVRIVFPVVPGTGDEGRVVVPDGNPPPTAVAPLTATPTPERTSPIIPTPSPTPVPSTPTPEPLFGGISGSAGVVVSQALTLRLGTVTSANGLVAVNDEGTQFTIAAETTVGSVFNVDLALCNASGSAVNGELQLSPAPSAGASRADDVTGLAQFAAGTWRFVMLPACDDFTPDITLSIRIPADLAPGFSGFTGFIRQVAF